MQSKWGERSTFLAKLWHHVISSYHFTPSSSFPSVININALSWASFPSIFFSANCHFAVSFRSSTFWTPLPSLKGHIADPAFATALFSLFLILIGTCCRLLSATVDPTASSLERRCCHLWFLCMVFVHYLLQYLPRRHDCGRWWVSDLRPSHIGVGNKRHALWD